MSSTNPLSEFIQKIKAAAEKIGHAIAGTFVALFGEDAAKKFAASAEAILKSDFGAVVTTIVQEVETTMQGAASDAKHGAALSKILTAAKTAGLDIKTNVLNLLIELAVQKISGTLGALAAVAK